MTVVGTDESGAVDVIDGAFICHMMDTFGLSLAEYSSMCQSIGIGWSVSGFVREGLRRGWTAKRIEAILIEDKPSSLDEATIRTLVQNIQGAVVSYV